MYIARVSRLRGPFLHDREIFATVDLLTEHAGVDAAEQEKPRGLTIDRVSRRRGTSGWEGEGPKLKAVDLQDEPALPG